MKHTSLYHGTDARMVRMSDSQRAAYKKGCFLVIDYIWDVFRDEYDYHFMKSFQQPLGYVAKTAGPWHPWLRLVHAMNHIGGYKNGNEHYSYNSFYLTGLRDRAIDYARDSFAGGESGMIVYDIAKVMDVLQPSCWKPTGAIAEAIKTIEEFGDAPATPVLFQFDDIALSMLQTESGNSDPKMVALALESGSLRYLGDVVLDLSKAEFLNLPPRK